MKLSDSLRVWARVSIDDQYDDLLEAAELLDTYGYELDRCQRLLDLIADDLAIDLSDYEDALGLDDV